MGPRQSSQTRSRQKQFFDNYEIIQELRNDNIRFLQHKQTKKEYLLRELSYTSKQEYLKAIETIKNKREQLKNSDHVIPLTEYFEKQEDQYCSTFYKLYVLYQYPQRTLDDEINERNLRKNTFTQTELWSILASCILGLSHLQKKGIRHASLRSNMIFLSHQGLIKISDPFTTGYQTNYETLLNKRNTRHIYLSPQQCQALQGELISPANINPYKSDIFTLGMIILECGLLQYQDQCYRDQYSRIHMETLQYNKNRFRKAYSQELANMLNYMLGQQATSRPEWIQLENYVITDTNRSFISEGRKSNILTQSKPVSVHRRISGQQNGSQSGIHLSGAGSGLQPRKPVSQKPIVTEQKPQQFIGNPPISGGKANIVSSFKPMSVQNFRPVNVHTSTFVPNYPVENNVVVSEYRPSLTMVPMSAPDVKVQNPPLFTGFSTGSTFQPYQPLPPLSAFPNTVTNIPNFVKPSYIVESPVKNQILSKNIEIIPNNPSNISTTRPFRSVFPNPNYTTKTKVDQNLVQVDDDDQTSRTISDLSQYNHQNDHLRKSQYTKGNAQYNFNSGSQILNQSPYQGISYNNKKSVTNFTVQSGNHQSSHQISQQSSPPPQNQSSTQAQFVIETFKLGSRYEGYKLSGMRHGQGKFFYQDGGMYDGEWIKNKMQGYGKLYYQSGKIAYQGMWVQDQFTGKGVLYNQNPDPLKEPFNYQNFDNVQELWTKYEGQFLEDSKNGKGVLYLSNGEYFEGNFVNDTAQGQGVYTTMGGKKIRGIWQANLLQRQL